MRFLTNGLSGREPLLIDPTKAKDGKNVIVLKGGAGRAYSQSFPQSVEIPVGVAATRLHFLGAVGGWAGIQGLPAQTVEIRFVGGRKQVVTHFAGRDFADYYPDDPEVPGSKIAAGLVKSHHVRTLVVAVDGPEVIEKVILTSPGNTVAPTTVAITAEIGGAPNPPKGTQPPPPPPCSLKIRLRLCLHRIPRHRHRRRRRRRHHCHRRHRTHHNRLHRHNQ